MKKILIKCIEQNLLLKKKKLIIHNFGNVSLRIDDNHMCIKPSGMKLESITKTDIPVINIITGKKVYGKFEPSTDTPTHLEIYRNFSKVMSISHTHSKYATAWAQSKKSIPLLGTTHSDYWKNEIPVIDYLPKQKVLRQYEKNTGKIIVSFLTKNRNSFFNCPGILLAGHGPFTWGLNHTDAVKIAEIIEYIAEMAFITSLIKIKKKIPKYIATKHFERKHGIKSYYGQKSVNERNKK